MRVIAGICMIIAVLTMNCATAGEVDMARLNAFAERVIEQRKTAVGYPINQDVHLKEFYEWYLTSGLHNTAMNNVGNPQKQSPLVMNTHEFEREVIAFFAPRFGFAPDEAWGIVTSSGTDGNNHGVYFGVKYLLAETGMRPVLYVSDEAHYSIKKLGDLQNLEMKLIPGDMMGHMNIEAFEAALETNKPALIVVAMGTTFKGAIDDQKGIDEVLKRKPPLAVYRHLDAALFGGYLSFTKHRDLVDRRVVNFDSIAVSGHKFFGFDEPTGFFITSKDVLDKQNPFKVPYLDDAVPTITCSRSALSPLKFWWKVQRTGEPGYIEQANRIIELADYMEEKLLAIGYPTWRNRFSNTVFFKRPSDAVMKKYNLAMEYDERLGGNLAHMIVMQHESKDVIDGLLADLAADAKQVEKDK